MESIILILVILGTFVLGYFTVNILFRSCEGNRDGRVHASGSPRKRKHGCLRQR